MASAPLHLPGLMEGGRKTALLYLMGLSLGEVLAQVAAAAALKSVLVGFSTGPLAATSLMITGLAAAVFAWGRTVFGERFGLSYVNDIRLQLARQAIAVASCGGPGQFGTIAIRMTGDLTAIKDWANKGICGGIAGCLGLIGGVFSAYIAAGYAGLITALAGPVLAILLLPLLYQGLQGRVRQRRKSKGRLSARIGHLLLSATPIAAYGAEQRAIRPIERVNRDVLSSTSHEVARSSLFQMPALLTLPLGAALAVILANYGLSPTDGVAGWAALLFAFSLTALALSLIGNAIVQLAERNIALARLHDLMGQANATVPSAPTGSQRLPPGPALSLSVHGETLAQAGETVFMPRANFEAVLPVILQGDASVCVDNHKANQIASVDWARRVAYAGALRPLPRGRIEQVLAAKRVASASRMKRALTVAGLPSDLLEDKAVLDPSSPALSPGMKARLQLARALSHRPRLLLLDDAALAQDTAIMAHLITFCEAQGVTLIVLTHSGHAQ